MASWLGAGEGFSLLRSLWGCLALLPFLCNAEKQIKHKWSKQISQKSSWGWSSHSAHIPSARGTPRSSIIISFELSLSSVFVFAKMQVHEWIVPCKLEKSSFKHTNSIKVFSAKTGLPSTTKSGLHSSISLNLSCMEGSIWGGEGGMEQQTWYVCVWKQKGKEWMCDSNNSDCSGSV